MHGRGANVNAVAKREGSIGDPTPMHIATVNGHANMVEKLHSLGAAIEAKDADGNTPLHLAASHNHPNVVGVLHKRGANVNAVDEVLSNTPLHMAAEAGHSEVVKLLIKHGADDKAKNVLGDTPLDLANEDVKNHLNIKG
ncbi:MAG: ankyrin repeat domain-containing protein [Alphaproteobacteria bacterium]|nr:ankyrin repeat domain-containing protein [Alphaproteobacteria bacterium]